MARKIVFGTYDSWETWGLTLTGFKLSDPEYKANYLKVPGMDGDLDLSAILTEGGARYNNRELRAFFELSTGTRESRLATFDEIVNALDGRSMAIVLPDDNTHQITGRLHVAIDYCDPYHGALTVIGNCYPWRLKSTQTTVARSDLSTSYKNLQLPNERRPVVPSITVGQTTTLSWNGNTYTVNAGTHRLLDIQLQAGDNLLKAKVSSGSGTISVTYQEASL